MSMTVEERVFKLTGAFFEIDSGALTRQSAFSGPVSGTDFEIDSLDQVELIMELESEFAIDIPDEQWESAGTLGDIIDIIERMV